MTDSRQAPAAVRTAIAPGRVCLAGEGCDWMLASAANWSFPLVSAKVTSQPETTADGRVIIDYADLGRAEVLDPGATRDGPPGSYAAACLRVLEDAGVRTPGCRMRVTSSVPRCGGLSSSAALCVALLRLMTRLAEAALDDTAIAEAAYAAENAMGIPCGRMDQYAIVTRGPAVIDSSDGGTAVRPLALRGPVSIVVAYNAQSGSAFSEQYPLVRARWEAGDPAIRRYIDTNADICDTLLRESRDGGIDAALLGRCVNRAHGAIVRDLLIENAEINQWVAAACQEGALGAKSCGARRQGGAMIAVCDPAAATAVVSALSVLHASTIVWNAHAS